jgi:enterochelin esterase-like enzyme
MFVLLMLMYCSVNISAQIPKVSFGNIRHFENFPSKYVAARNVEIWLPDDYSSAKKYSVLYMQDGRSLFDADITWNKQTWDVDKVLGQLLAENKIKECIVIGPWNSETTRHNDYLPQKPFESLNKKKQELILHAKRADGRAIFTDYRIQSDNYLRFLVQELKPFIDSNFSTLPGPQNTFIAGSSMGGLISLYAICEYPDVFGGAACLSTHWTGIFSADNNPFPAAMLQYLGGHLPSPQAHKIYFDHGTSTLDSLYKPFQLMADKKMKKKGFSPANWITKVFPGADHSENAWKQRLDIPLLFLLKK